MNVLLIAIGSHGDVHPFVGLGMRLQQRGHAVTVLANQHFESLVRKAGLGFLQLGTDEEFLELTKNPDLWHASRGFKAVMTSIEPILEPVFDATRQFVTTQSDALVVASSLGIGARVAREVETFPFVTVHLAPSIFRSLYDPPHMFPVSMTRYMPIWMRRKMWEGGDRFVIDPVLCPWLNAFRAKFGLKPITRVFDVWLHSPDRTIGLFPDWFAPKPVDWPAQVRLTGFPLYDEKGIEPLSADLLKFLEAGDKPIAFTPGSAFRQGDRFFRTAADACALLGRRGLLLTRHPENIPSTLPPGVIHVPYAPFSELLPHCSALVYHGGIGTLSQACAAGVPHLVMPMSHDQPDNAWRLKNLGVGDTISPSKFTSKNVAKVLMRLIDSPDVKAACQSVVAKMSGHDGIEETCDLIEAVTTSNASRVAAV